MSTNSLSFKVESLRKLPDPIFPEKYQRYFAVCNTKNLPQTIPMETNPRKQNLNTKVAKKILGSYSGKDSDQLFHLLNRGLLISAQEVSFNNNTSELTIKLPDTSFHGLVDGGHTYRIITENLQELTQDQFITLEIITGIESNFESLAGARNTSVQVKEKSLAELEGKLDIIKQMVDKEPFKQDVAYVENDIEKEIDVLDLIALLTIFHNDIHQNSQPVYTYSSKASALSVYLKNIQSYSYFLPVANKIFELHDHVKKTMADLYKKSGGKLGRLKEIGYKDGKKKWPLYYSPKTNGSFTKIEYDIPTGFVYPILGAMRFLLTYDKSKGAYTWKSDPIKFYNKQVGEKLVELTMLASQELGRNPMAVGKSSRHWEGLFNYAAKTYLMVNQDN